MNAEIAKEILALLTGAAMQGPAGIAGSVLASATGGNGAGRSDGVAGHYPEEFSPDYYHNYDVTYAPKPDGVKGPYQNMNYMGHANAAVIDEAGRMQTLEEHRNALTKYFAPGQTPAQRREALRRGVEEEKKLPQFWAESKSRVPFSVSSSAVKAIRLTPDGRVEVKWGGKPSKKNPSGWYTFKQYPDVQQASLAAQKLLQSDSIGRAVYPVLTRPTKNPLLGKWNKDNYDGSMAV